jgi:hypothetical protein
MADIRHMPVPIRHSQLRQKVSAPVLQFAVIRHSFYIGMANQAEHSELNVGRLIH